jgi:hypothetical protein
MYQKSEQATVFISTQPCYITEGGKSVCGLFPFLSHEYQNLTAMLETGEHCSYVHTLPMHF